MTEAPSSVPGLPSWHPIYDTARAAFCIVLLTAVGLEIYEHDGAWAIMLAIVLIGGMAS